MLAALSALPHCCQVLPNLEQPLLAFALPAVTSVALDGSVHGTQRHVYIGWMLEYCAMVAVHLDRSLSFSVLKAKAFAMSNMGCRQDCW